MRSWVLALVLLGCYDPSYRQCAVRCASTSECAPSQVCRADGWCVAPESTAQCTAPDAIGMDASLPDAPPSTPIDAPPAACSPGCSGTCVDGVCVIRCMGNKSCSTVACPAIGACRIECIGKESCKHVACGTGPCTVICSGDTSCKEGVWCAAACACEVACTGDEACDGAATCPAPTCRAGDGCTSSGPGCDGC